MAKNVSAENKIRNVRRKTRRQYTAEEKIRIVLEGLQGESTIAELCRREGINQNLYYRWSKEFLEAGKERLNGNTQRQAYSVEVKALYQENEPLKQLVAELADLSLAFQHKLQTINWPEIGCVSSRNCSIFVF